MRTLAARTVESYPCKRQKRLFIWIVDDTNGYDKLYDIRLNLGESSNGIFAMILGNDGVSMVCRFILFREIQMF